VGCGIKIKAGAVGEMSAQYGVVSKEAAIRVPGGCDGVRLLDCKVMYWYEWARHTHWPPLMVPFAAK
jgi:hypothetical protein